MRRLDTFTAKPVEKTLWYHDGSTNDRGRLVGEIEFLIELVVAALEMRLEGVGNVAPMARGETTAPIQLKCSLTRLQRTWDGFAGHGFRTRLHPDDLSRSDNVARTHRDHPLICFKTRGSAG
jgi:hypothetical protein